MSVDGLCPCGHDDDGYEMCIGGKIYGPCGCEGCGGVCVMIDDCQSLPGCCEVRSSRRAE